MSGKDRIAIVEDEADLADSMVFSFKREGYDARAYRLGQEALDAFAAEQPDLILLDLMLPDMSGLDVCRTLRANPLFKTVPIIMVTARSDEIDRVVGFEVGADDYVVKPFSVRELVLRARAVLRRRHVASEPESPGEQELVTFGRLRVDTHGRQVFVEEDERKITALEFRLLTTLLERKGRVQTRETLLSDVWGVNPELTTRTVDTHVKRLREKIDPVGHYIETVRGFGYRFRTTPPDGE